MSKLEDALWEADDALKRLAPEQGRVARKNARTAMLKALRKARKALDEEYPLKRKPVRRRRKKRTPREALRGFREISERDFRALTLAGVNKNQFRSRPRPGALEARKRAQAANKRRRPNESKVMVPVAPTVMWAPKWMVDALDARIDVATIAKAVRSQSTRRQITTMVRLGIGHRS